MSLWYFLVKDISMHVCGTLYRSVGRDRCKSYAHAMGNKGECIGIYRLANCLGWVELDGMWRIWYPFYLSTSFYPCLTNVSHINLLPFRTFDLYYIISRFMCKMCFLCFLDRHIYHPIPQMITKSSTPILHPIPQMVTKTSTPIYYPIPQMSTKSSTPILHPIPQMITKSSTQIYNPIPQMSTQSSTPICHPIPQMITKSSTPIYHPIPQMSTKSSTPIYHPIPQMFTKSSLIY